MWVFVYVYCMYLMLCRSWIDNVSFCAVNVGVAIHNAKVHQYRNIFELQPMGFQTTVEVGY